MTTINITTTYTVIDCYKCGALFAVPNDVDDELVRSGRAFYCPNGHGQSYRESTEEQLRKEREKNARITARLDQVKADRDATQRSLVATKGQVTRVKNRIANGACPCCNRTFADLAAHMATKHPKYAEPAKS
jgi:hypothetical protein